MGASRKSKTAGELFYTEGCVWVRQRALHQPRKVLPEWLDHQIQLRC